MINDKYQYESNNQNKPKINKQKIKKLKLKQQTSKSEGEKRKVERIIEEKGESKNKNKRRGNDEFKKN